MRYILDNNINHRLPGWRTKFAVLLITLALLIPLSTFQLLAFDGTTPSQTESDYYRNSPEITIDSNAIKVTLTAKDGQKTVLSGSMNQFPVLWPEKDVRSSIVSPFGDFFHPILKKQTHHDGVDIHSHFRTPLVATADGIVDGEKLVEGYGKYVVIQHRYFKTRYGHLDEVTVKPGSVVKRGDIIGYSGNTGMSTGPHLHYEIRYDSKPLDPKAFLDAGKTLP